MPNDVFIEWLKKFRCSCETRDIEKYPGTRALLSLKLTIVLVLLRRRVVEDEEESYHAEQCYTRWLRVYGKSVVCGSMRTPR